MTLTNWLLKSIIHAKTCFFSFFLFEIFFFCIQIQYDLLLLLLSRDLAVCMKTKHFIFLFFIFYFFYVLTKTGYFNTGFVSLQYINTNQY